MHAAEGHADHDTFLIDNQFLDRKVQAGEGCAKQNHPFNDSGPGSISVGAAWFTKVAATYVSTSASMLVAR